MSKKGGPASLDGCRLPRNNYEPSWSRLHTWSTTFAEATPNEKTSGARKDRGRGAGLQAAEGSEVEVAFAHIAQEPEPSGNKDSVGAIQESACLLDGREKCFRGPKGPSRSDRIWTLPSLRKKQIQDYWPGRTSYLCRTNRYTRP